MKLKSGKVTDSSRLESEESGPSTPSFETLMAREIKKSLSGPTGHAVHWFVLSCASFRPSTAFSDRLGESYHAAVTKGFMQLLERSICHR